MGYCGLKGSVGTSTPVHDSGQLGGLSSRGLSPALPLLARAFLNQPGGTETSPTPGIMSMVLRLSRVAWLKYAALAFGQLEVWAP